MLQFLSRRLLLLIPVLIGIVFITFGIVRLIPGDPCVTMLGERATPQKCQQFLERYGLNDNFAVQFVRYLSNMAQGDLGLSIKFSRPVADIIAERLPLTIELTLCAMLFSTVFGVLFGVISALKRNSFIDTLTMIGANIGVSMPVFWLGLMLAYVFALMLKGTPFFIPPSGRFSAGLTLMSLSRYWGLKNVTGFEKFVIDFMSNSLLLNAIITGNWKAVKDGLWHLILPAIAVGTIPMAVIARMTRSSLLEVLGLDYIRTARAKGLIERLVISKHAMRNAMIPIVTIIGIETGSLLSGAVLTETVFALPGVGTSLVNAILSRDYPVVQGFTLIIAIIFVLVNLIVDISYAYLDPRIRIE
ncbi:ABC transporter permease [Leptolinea tardivitalis]|uniref:Peptide ABC transporter permease n=1 Tax=Leptolinea tardivitalis TaxID=229920 RepID=A0A0P6WQP8_9CHLR|nr:ABC transporter permease [Leptolinea tardivitalis]KPL72374.1 peptide ABC transporter permease [Leptolinea tardivitalis]GAP22797.1 ABC-type dipeptide/oligopeptide/nickel transport system, permease component [Leptolinea tardivitalis]